MAQTQTIELPTDVYEALMRAAGESRMTPASWIALRLPEDELAGWDMEELRRMVTSGIKQINRGDYEEYASGDELANAIIAKADARAAKKA